MTDGVPFLIGENASRAFVCLNQKAGSTSWKLAFLRANPKAVRFHSLTRSPHGAPAMEGCDTYKNATANIPRFMVVRNPYSRLLSGYLDKCILKSESGPCPMNVSHARKNPVSGFAELVARVQSKAKLNAHFSLLTHHCGIQAGYDYYLRVEQIDQWYSPFVNVTGLARAVRFDWNKTTHWWIGKSQCFHQVVGQDCDGQSLNVSDSFNTGGGHSFHATSSNSRLDEFYNVSLAWAVTEWARPDLVEFGYPLWGGVNGDAYLRNISM
eukprot:CAMPEP_0119312562 /NCGR_PEP_ID=MMETSP1333-20130426/26884_1 /TAXON_ID=418940 /ORGANISM="Scyphosphaera apsteinii, Strain RCC1455" /LENGTH=266 /DNA_ID=CAMNT_0007317203 /DNA_START=199 /DNA_END=999 /DNA_ORIENTATION=-